MEGNNGALFKNDVSTQQQYFDTFRRNEPLEPEKALLMALLEDAIHCYRKYATARDQTGKQLFREAEEWIKSGAGGWIFSFETVCELLGLDAQYLRRGLLGSAAAPVEGQTKGRRGTPHRRAA